MTTEKKPLSVRKLVKQVENLFKLQARSKDLKLDFHVGVSVPSRISGDATHIKQILMNLVSNAVKFTEKGSISLTVGYDEDLESIFFNVKDTGSGISNDLQEKIFDSFLTGTSEGTGLGLSISKRILRAHDGDLELVESGVNGTIFKISLPTT